MENKGPLVEERRLTLEGCAVGQHEPDCGGHVRRHNDKQPKADENGNFVEFPGMEIHNMNFLMITIVPL